MKNLTPEMIEKAEAAGSAEELYALAKENGIDMTEESANAYFEQLHKTGELSDNELEDVSGGGCYKNGHLIVTCYHVCGHWACYRCGSNETWNSNDEKVHFCHDGVQCNGVTCTTCKHEKYKSGLLLCMR